MKQQNPLEQWSIEFCISYSYVNKIALATALLWGRVVVHIYFYTTYTTHQNCSNAIHFSVHLNWQKI